MPHARGVLWARFRITAAVIAAVAILSVVVYLLTGGTLLQSKATLYLDLPDATGLDAGSAVRVNGTTVGKVGSVRLSGSNDPNRVVRLILNVERAHLPDIPSDSTAQIGSEGAVGDKYVDISQGRSPVRIRAGGEIRYKAAPELLKSLDLQQFAQQLRSIDATLTGIEQGRGPVGELVVGTQVYDDIRKDLEVSDDAFRKATAPTTSVGRLLATDEDYRKIRDPLVQIDDRLARIQAGQGDAGHLLREDGQYTHLLEQTTGLRRSIADLRAQPLLTSDAQYVSWTRALQSYIRRVDRFNASPGFSSSIAYDNLTGLARDMRASMRDFRQNPKKYLRLHLF